MTYAFPGFVDVHVHFRDPGVPEAETTASGLAAAARGGFAAVVTMPNTTPACDSVEVMEYQRRAAKCCEEAPQPLLFPSACISKGRLGKEVADLETLAAAGAAFFTDDGTYVSDAKVMEEAMRRTAALGLVVSQHALAPGLSEADCIRRDLSLCRTTGCRLHVQHISTAEGVGLVRDARKEGLPVTAEATPHHVLLCQDDIRDRNAADAGNFKMAPPLATREDRAEVRRAVKDGVLMFATDHAPHPAARKLVGYEKAANGIIGLETAIAITHHVLVEEEGMPIDKWAEAWWKLPREILPSALVASLEGSTTTVEVGDLRVVDPATFASRSRNCPYAGLAFRAWPKIF